MEGGRPRPRSAQDQARRLSKGTSGLRQAVIHCLPFLFSRMHDKLMELIEWYRHALESGGYPLIALLMAIESSFVPLPSELVIPFAAHYAHTQGHMTLTGVVIAGAIGSWIGATFMYWMARWAGRPLVLRYGKFFFVPPAKVEQAERWSTM